MESGFKVVPESRLLTIIFTLILNSSCTIREETFLWTVDESSVPEGECQYECSVFTFTFSFLTFATFFEPNLPSPYVSSSLLILLNVMLIWSPVLKIKVILKISLQWVRMSRIYSNICQGCRRVEFNSVPTYLL